VVLSGPVTDVIQVDDVTNRIGGGYKWSASAICIFRELRKLYH
jgi:hypothetical protein